MTEFWLKYGLPLLSLVGFGQFWIWLFLQRSKRTLKLELYESGTVEIGFDANGPLIGVAGVLRARNQEVFVQAMELTLIRNRDKSNYSFRWMAFKPNFWLPRTAVKAWEMSHPFVVMPRELGKFNVVFHDIESFTQVKGVLQHYYHHWHEVERKILERRTLKPDQDGLLEHEDLIREFKKQEICVNSYTELNQKCYWEQGDYTLILKVCTEGAGADIVGTFHFNLGKPEVNLLKANCVTILDEPIAALMGKPLISCKAVQAEYSQSK